MIKADLKHWVTKREKKGPFNPDYLKFAAQAKERLGAEGLVGIPNAREDEPRYEEFFKIANKKSSIDTLGGDGRVFYDEKYDLFFVKAQELNFQTHNGRLTSLVYNIPFKENFNEKNHEALKNPETITILNLPSCEYFPEAEELKYFDGVAVHVSTMELFPGANKKAENFYNPFIKGKEFGNSEVLPHKIGPVAFSGGHRSPKGLIEKIIPPSVGSSYTLLPEFTGNTQEDFFNYLRDSIQNSTPDNLHKGSCAGEMLFRHIPSMIVSKYFKK